MTTPTWPDGTATGAPPAADGPWTGGDPYGESAAVAVAAQVGRHWGLPVVLGLLAVAAGVAVLAWPGETVLVIAVLVGVQLLVNGIIRVVQSIAADASGGERLLLLLVGIFSILVGVLCLRNILQTVAALAVLVGVFWLVTGVLDVVAGLSPGSVPGRGWRLLSGALSVLAGIVILAYPGISLGTLAVLVGIWLLLYGGVLIVTGFALRSDLRNQAALARA